MAFETLCSVKRPCKILIFQDKIRLRIEMFRSATWQFSLQIDCTKSHWHDTTVHLDVLNIFDHSYLEN